MVAFKEDIRTTPDARAFKAAQAALFSGWAVPSKGAKLEPWKYDPAPLGPLDVEIAVTHNGLCHTDIHMRVGCTFCATGAA